MQIKRIVILMLILLSSVQGFSQKSKVVLNGVIFADNGQPAEGVSVALKGTNYAALTNANGEYEITAEPGNYTLVVNFVGYKSKQTKINLYASFGIFNCIDRFNYEFSLGSRKHILDNWRFYQ